MRVADDGSAAFIAIHCIVKVKDEGQGEDGGRRQWVAGAAHWKFLQER
jgi:hypothetical protein